MKKKIIIISGAILIVALIVIISLYVANEPTREWIDTYILRKNVIEEDLPTIALENENANVYAYDNHIVVLQENNLVIYNSSGKEETTINVSITTPIFADSGNYLLVADKNGQNVYLIYNTSLQWQKTMEGNISAITVNENGAVGVVITGTTYKSVIVMYGITGEEEFKTYLSSTIAADVAISENSDYLSFAEIDTSGTIISSAVKTVSVEKAKNSPSEAIIYEYKPEENSLIVNIQYDNQEIICQYDNTVYKMNEGNAQKLIDIDDKTTFMDINLHNYICRIVETSSGILSSQYEAKIMNPDNKKENSYLLNSVPKSLYCNNDIIAINMGNQIEFINHNAWLIKSFVSSQSFKDVVLGKSVAGIIYRDRIEIINL